MTSMNQDLLDAGILLPFDKCVEVCKSKFVKLQKSTRLVINLLICHSRGISTDILMLTLYFQGGMVVCLGQTLASRSS